MYLSKTSSELKVIGKVNLAKGVDVVAAVDEGKLHIAVNEITFSYDYTPESYCHAVELFGKIFLHFLLKEEYVKWSGEKLTISKIVAGK